ncbi:hypothetical protein ACUNWD_09265 [Sunxiuqinia sp. A32]|uniref:hypothetical protein n=1 Tax=Sunxiuqinia sp. A32 TaxID=3461496 RepID=UPI004046370E
MKKYTLISLFIFFSSVLFAQSNYKYVIIPTQFSEIGSGFNPHNISSSIQRILNEKGIKSAFESSDRPFDYCDALRVNLVNTSNMFKNKLKVKFFDCQNRMVWESDGSGISKEYDKGFAEAFEDAIKDLDELPLNKNAAKIQIKVTETPAEEPIAETEVNLVPEAKPIKAESPAIEGDADSEIYRPTNLFYNYRYSVDVIENTDGSLKILILNGESLGYDKLQVIAKLSPSGLDDVYTVRWTKPDGNQLDGLANMTGKTLKISLQDGDSKEVIQLAKY